MSTHRWTEDHGDPGLRRKFDVYKPKDDVAPPGVGYSMFAQDARIGADGEFVFVLRPETDVHACSALRWYAHYVEDRDPQLAHDIRNKLSRIEGANRP